MRLYDHIVRHPYADEGGAMNWGAFVKHLLAGFLNGFFAIAGADAFLSTDIEGWKMAVVVGFIGILRALQEWVSPTSYIRPPQSDAAITLAGGKK